jgi:hypothetical protein
MSAERPSETLRRAADLIAQKAAMAVDGDWWADASLTHDSPVVMSTHESGLVAVVPDERTSEWIAMLSPAVAAHLTEWLRVEADCLDGNVTNTVVDAMSALVPGSEVTAVVDTSGAALAFARSVLGVPAGEDG